MIGKTLRPYRIISQIGLGGMATVYKAYQPSIERYVALKVLSTHSAQDPGFIKCFQQEAKIIARPEHARILPVYDHGDDFGNPKSGWWQTEPLEARWDNLKVWDISKWLMLTVGSRADPARAFAKPILRLPPTRVFAPWQSEKRQAGNLRAFEQNRLDLRVTSRINKQAGYAEPAHSAGGKDEDPLDA